MATDSIARVLALSALSSSEDSIADELVTELSDATENTKIAYEQTENEIEIPTMDDLNSLRLIAEGAHQAVSYSNYQEFVADFNTTPKGKHNLGQNIYIVTDGVPDLWVQEISDTSQTYTYTNDNAIVQALNTNGYIQVGYYIVGHLETQKIDLDSYVKFTDHATSSKEGTVKLGNGFNVASDGTAYATIQLPNQYETASDNHFMSKGTLEGIKEDYVKRALTSLEQDEYSEEEQSTVNALIGSVPKSAFVYDPDTETLSISLI